MALAAVAFRRQAGQRDEPLGRALITWAGAVVPTLVVGALLVTGLLTLRALAARTPDLAVHVDGEQWWWRVVYETPGGPVETANEIRLPRGETAGLSLTADDVIHSFWAPALGGKMDMIPGRTNRLTLTPTLVGSWGGLCAEYCGGAHAQMRFEVVVMEADSFRDWLAAEARPAAPEAMADAAGLAAFLDAGCGACHTVRGTPASGAVGPDLTHLASRGRVGAGLLPLTEPNLRRWITDTEAVKPGVTMPPYPDLPPAALDDVTRFLMALR